ncbi:outer membrane beta-barrel protein [Rhizorhabdus wittichii]|uniref:outer membrane beta-barrel protein n=1 Tax=Rhizorhabdus wittichii TaxID=160791 RepID=UPI0002DB39ED|nr:outer membrane beta-barrel protein [Rhizorhabdus wittichii]
MRIPQLLTVLSGTALCSAVQAQEIPPNVGVADRERPAFDALGLRAGSLLIYPSVAGRTEYDDNVLATGAGKRGDTIFTIEPEVRVRSDLARHAFDVKAYYHRSFHAKLDTEDASEYGVNGRGVVDVTRRTRIRLTGSAERNAETRSSLASFSGSRTRVKYDRFSGSAGLEQEVGDFVLLGKGEYRRIRYMDTTDPLGNPIDLSFRNLKVRTGTGQIAYRLRSGTSAFIRVQSEKRTYDLRPGDPGFDPITQTDRSSKGLKAEAGLGLELTSLIYGNIRLGYMKQNYADPKLRDVSGLSYGADILWNVTPLTSLKFTAERAVDETSSQTTAGNLRSEFTADVDHELLRNLILSAGVRYARINPAGLSPKSREYEARLGARYLLPNRFMELRAGYAFEKRSSANPSIRFNSNNIFVTLTIKR